MAEMFKSRYNHLKHIAAIGGKSVYKKYGTIGGNPEKRKAAWKKWWDEKGRWRKNPILLPRSITKPKRTATLAEFVGIMLGDGGISKYQINITLNRYTDSAYAIYVQELIRLLFRIIPGRRDDSKDSTIVLIISRLALVQWLVESVGLVRGHKIKQQVDIPSWIKKNRLFARACLRGLVDTDGSVFTHQYRVGNKKYYYKKLEFCTLSKPLLKSSLKIFRENGMHPTINRNKILRLDSRKDIRQYFAVIGTHNPKHLKRYES